MLKLFDVEISESGLKETPTLALAYIGDGVYELLARAYILGKGNAKVSMLHKRVVAMTRAEAQAAAALAILPMLSEAEKAVFIRGRNAKPHSAPKNATAREYALATGLEALFGWLWLSGGEDRLGQIWGAVLAGFEAAGGDG